jgi:cobalamin biosynthesis protein CobD/CbiB
MTAASFAIAGDFEDATYCWRSAIAAGAGRDSRAMLVAVGSGALGLDLADPVRDRAWTVAGATPFDWHGAEPDVPGVRSAIGLIWRAATLLFGLFALVSLSGWLGG